MTRTKTSICSLLAVFTILLSLVPMTSAQAQKETVDSIVAGFERQKIAALNTYVEKTPDALDAFTACEELIKAHQTIGETAKLPPLYMKQYAMLKKGADANVNVMFPTVVIPCIEAMKEQGPSQRAPAKAFLDKVKADLQGHDMADDLAKFLDEQKTMLDAPMLGDAVTIKGTTISGETYDLSTMQDKVILVDFWATWCGPCVRELPHVKDAYEKMHDKGFEVLGISLDTKLKTLTDFTSKQKMPWPQLCDLKRWEGELVKQFKVTSIPATYLVKNGKVIGSNLRGEALSEAVAKALGL